MGVYAGLGIAQAVAFFLMGSMFAFLSYFASKQLHKVCFTLYALQFFPEDILARDRACYARTYVIFRNDGQYATPFPMTPDSHLSIRCSRWAES